MAKLTGGGRYVKGVVVGKGTFGVVFKAYDTHVSTERMVAVSSSRRGVRFEIISADVLRHDSPLKRAQ